MPERPIEPREVVELIENYVNQQYVDASRYDNSSLLDADGVSSLHTVAARVYALGFADGETAQAAREQGERNRARGVS